MTIIRNTLTLLLILITTTAQAQSDWQSFLEALSADEDYDAEMIEQMHEIISDLVENPLNINTASYDDMKATLIIDDRQINEIMRYRDTHHGLKDIRELRMIRSLSRDRCSLLMCVTYAGENGEKDNRSIMNRLRTGRSEMTGTLKIPLYERKGDKDGYLGDPLKHSVRYIFSSRNDMKIGLIGSKDAGEPFLKGRNGSGYDFYSAFVALRNVGRWKQITLGRYRMRTGMGLVMNTYFGMGKTTMLPSMLNSNTISAGYTSRSEADYMQGAAATYSITRHTDVTAFASVRAIDATLSGDSAIRTILTTGYHRTESEMNRSRNAWLKTAGVNIAWRRNGWHAGATAVAYGLSKDLQPDKKQLYKRYYLTGNNFYNISADYGYTGPHLQATGETATGTSGGIATINTINCQPADGVELTAVQRFYSYRYNALFSKSFSDGGSVKNESGIMAAVRWKALSWLQIAAYTDYAYFPWARYLVSRSSHSWDNMVEATAKKGALTLDARYKIKQKQRDNAAKDGLVDYAEHRGRIRIRYDGDTWNAGIQGDYSKSTLYDGSNGWMVSCNTSVTAAQWMRLYANAGYFHTDDYQSRIYLYERSMLYSFSFPMFYGRGFHCSLMAEAQIGKNAKIALKAAGTKYNDRDHISDGLQQIDGNSITDIECQLRLKF